MSLRKLNQVEGGSKNNTQVMAGGGDIIENLGSSESASNGNKTSSMFPLMFTWQKKKTNLFVDSDFLTLQTESGNSKLEPFIQLSISKLMSAEFLSDNDGKQESSLNIHYIKDCKEKKLIHNILTLYGSESDCSTTVEIINNLLLSVLKRPKRLLVFVNPESGRRKGKKVYEKVAPLFSLCKITTDVIVTERKNHAKNLLGTYDLSNIDAVVVVGGDGSYFEVINGLLIRVQKEASINMDQPGTEWLPSKLPVGIIPSGTGNGIAMTLEGYDPVTAALSIIIGKLREMPTYSINQMSTGFLTFGGLLMGYGGFGDMIYKSERQRWLGVMRYPVFLVSGIFTLRKFDAEIEYKEYYQETSTKSTEQEEEEEEPEGEEEGELTKEKVKQKSKESKEKVKDAKRAQKAHEKAERKSEESGDKDDMVALPADPGWVKFGGCFVGIFFFSSLENLPHDNQFSEVSVCNNTLEMLKLGFEMMKKLKTPPDSVKSFKTQRLRIKILPKRDNQEWSNMELSLNCDGESIIMTPDPWIDISIQRGLIQAFCY